MKLYQCSSAVRKISKINPVGVVNPTLWGCYVGAESKSKSFEFHIWTKVNKKKKKTPLKPWKCQRAVATSYILLHHTTLEHDTIAGSWKHF